MLSKALFLICFVISTALLLTVIYIEIKILSQMIFFEEPVYSLYHYRIILKGATAALLHIFNISIGLSAVLVAAYCYGKFRN
jgi:hypothetical protein